MKYHVFNLIHKTEVLFIIFIKMCIKLNASDKIKDGIWNETVVKSDMFDLDINQFFLLV